MSAALEEAPAQEEDALYNPGIPDTPQTFPSANEALVYVQKYAHDHDYAVTKRSGSDKSNVKLKCDKWDTYGNRLGARKN